MARPLDSAEASFVAERELLGIRDRSLRRTILVASGQPQRSLEETRLLFWVLKNEERTLLRDRAVVTVHTNRNYVLRSLRHER